MNYCKFDESDLLGVTYIATVYFACTTLVFIIHRKFASKIAETLDLAWEKLNFYSTVHVIRYNVHK